MNRTSINCFVKYTHQLTTNSDAVLAKEELGALNQGILGWNGGFGKQETSVAKITRISLIWSIKNKMMPCFAVASKDQPKPVIMQLPCLRGLRVIPLPLLPKCFSGLLHKNSSIGVGTECQHRSGYRTMNWGARIVFITTL